MRKYTLASMNSKIQIYLTIDNELLNLVLGNFKKKTRKNNRILEEME